MTMLEKDIEAKGRDYARSRGHGHYKFSSPAHAAVPDRLLLAPVPPFLRELIGKYVRFVEYKRQGEKPTPPQLREHARLKLMGFTVEVVDNVEDAKRVIDEMGDPQ